MHSKQSFNFMFRNEREPVDLVDCLCILASEFRAHEGQGLSPETREEIAAPCINLELHCVFCGPHVRPDNGCFEPFASSIQILTVIHMFYIGPDVYIIPVFLGSPCFYGDMSVFLKNNILWAPARSMIVPCHAQVAIRDELRRSKGDVPSAQSLKAYVSGGILPIPSNFNQ